MGHQILICTVGTSLFRPNLERLTAELQSGSLSGELRELAEAYRSGNGLQIAKLLGRLNPSERLCGAEINSIAGMIEKGYVEPETGLFFLHSQTEEGRRIASIVKAYYSARGHNPVELVEVADLQDKDPKRFRNQGLRNLVREMAKVVRERSPQACAINATGGYKAQIAVAVVLGQALGVTVYYKHELFDEVIAFPPLPVALNFELWMQASGILRDLASNPQGFVLAETYAEEWDDRYDSLVEQETIDGKKYLALTPVGQIFYETFKDRFQSQADSIVPPRAPAPSKRPPHCEKAGWPGEHPEVGRFLQRVTDEAPFVVQCKTYYFNPDLSQKKRFRLSSEGIEGIFSDGSYCVKFRVETTARTAGERKAAVAGLIEWLDDPKWFQSRH